MGVDVLWKPWKLLLLVAIGVVGAVACVGCLAIFTTYVAANEAADWIREHPEGVIALVEGSPSSWSASSFALDTGQISDWFGGPVTAGYHDPSYEAYFGHPHNGVDVSLPEGSPVPAAMEGTVVFAGWNDQGYGNLVIVQNGPWTTYYGHLSAIGVQVGQEVQRGEVIALSGNTGVSTGPHLHYEVRYDGVPIPPSTNPGGGEAGEEEP